MLGMASGLRQTPPEECLLRCKDAERRAAALCYLL
jgi:hypothetical protein